MFNELWSDDDTWKRGDEDDVKCRVCANGGQLALCDAQCGSAFCLDCLETHFPEEGVRAILTSDGTWICLRCRPVCERRKLPPVPQAAPLAPLPAAAAQATPLRALPNSAVREAPAAAPKSPLMLRLGSVFSASRRSAALKENTDSAASLGGSSGGLAMAAEKKASGKRKKLLATHHLGGSNV